MRARSVRKIVREGYCLIDVLISRVISPAEPALMSWHAPNGRRGSSGARAFGYNSLAGPSHGGDYTLNDNDIEESLRNA